MSNTDVNYTDLKNTVISIREYVDHMDVDMTIASKNVLGLASGSWLGTDGMQYITQWGMQMAPDSVYSKYKADLTYFADYIDYVSRRYQSAQNNAKTKMAQFR